MKPNTLKLLAALIAGALLPLAFAPFHLFIFAFLCPAVLAYIWQKSNRKFAALTGLCFGIGLFGVGASWIFVSVHQFSDTHIAIALLITVLFVVILAAFIALQGLFYRFFIKHNNYFVLLLAFPSAWVLFEWIRSWLFTGFPWLFLGYSQVDTFLAGYAPILGVYGVSWLCAASGVLFLSYFIFSKRYYLLTTLLLLAIWLGGFALKQINWTQTIGNPVTLGLLQGNIDQNLKWEKATQKFIIQRYENLSHSASAAHTIIWPEASFPVALPYSEPLLNDMANTLTMQGKNALVGLPIINSKGNYYNGIVAIGEQAEGLYYKRHLVPFGEFVPFENLLRGMIGFFNLPMSHMSAGPHDQNLLQAGSLRFASLICYEIVYPNLTLESALNSNILLTISNDAWFGESLGPHQHFQMARMRALELGRYLARSTNNGITAIVDSKGRVVARAPQFVSTVLIGDVFAMSGETPLYFLTHYFVLLLSSLLFLGAVLLSYNCKHMERHNATPSI
ncbi:MAG: apolipoprotein N-acyltransferase [Legionellales bacterium]|jgi:apolipoprotein N-acyltransferase